MNDDDLRYGPPAWLGIGFLLFLILMIWGAVEAIAAPSVRVSVYQGIAPISENRETLEYIWKYSANKIRRELGVRLVKTGWKTYKMKNRDILAYNPIDIYDQLALDLERVARNSKYASFSFSAPPLYNGKPIALGDTRSYSCDKIAWTLALATITHEEIGHPLAILTTSHELGHLLGANHSSDSIMDANAYSLIKDGVTELYFNEQSKKEVRQCMRRV